MTGRSSPAISAMSLPQSPAHTTTVEVSMVTPVGLDAFDAPVLDFETRHGRVGEGLQLARGLRVLHQLANHNLRARESPDPRPDPTWLPGSCSSSISGHFSLASPGLMSETLVPKALPEPTFLFSSSMRSSSPTRATSMTADAAVVPHLLVEVDAVQGRIARHVIVGRGVAEVGGVGRRADIGRDGRLVDADDTVPATLDEMMGNACSDDATRSDDYDVCARWEVRH